MATKVLINRLKELRKESEKTEMDSYTAKQKLIESFDLGFQLSLKMNDPLMQKMLNGTILIWKEYLDGYEKHNFDVHGCCSIILYSWHKYIERMKAEQAEMIRQRKLSELKKAGRI